MFVVVGAEINFASPHNLAQAAYSHFHNVSRVSASLIRRVFLSLSCPRARAQRYVWLFISQFYGFYHKKNMHDTYTKTQRERRRNSIAKNSLVFILFSSFRIEIAKGVMLEKSQDQRYQKQAFPDFTYGEREKKSREI